MKEYGIKKTPDISWRYTKSILILWFFLSPLGPSYGAKPTPKPVLHSSVAAVSYPTPPLNVPLGHWTHAFRLRLRCPQQILSTKDLDLIKQTTETLSFNANHLMRQCSEKQSEYLVQEVCNGINATYRTLEKSLTDLQAMRNQTIAEVTLTWKLLGESVCAANQTLTRRKREISGSDLSKPTGSQVADILVSSIHNEGDGVIQINIHSSGSQNVVGTSIRKDTHSMYERRLELPTLENIETPAWNTALRSIKDKFGREVKQEIALLVKQLARTYSHDKSNHTSTADALRQQTLLNKIKEFPDQVLQELCTWRLSLAACMVKSESSSIGDQNQDTLSANRTKRSADLSTDPGILNWKWSLNKWIWGGLNSEDAKAINERFSENEGTLKNMTMTIQQVLNATISASETANHEINAALDEVQQHVNIISSDVKAWADTLRSKMTNLTDQMMNIELSIIVLSWKIQTQKILESLHGLYLSLRDLRDYYRKLSAMIGQQHLSLEVIPITDITAVIQHAAKAISSSLGVIGYSDPIMLVSNVPTSCYLMNQSLVLSVEIPLINQEYDYVTWRINSIPFYVKGQWLQLDTDLVAINIDKSRGVWQGFTEAGVAMCKTNNLNLCPFSTSVRDTEEKSCLYSLVTGSPDIENLCELRAVTNALATNHYILPITNNEWLISVGPHPMKGMRRCPDAAGVMVDTALEFTSVTYLRLATQCSLTIGGAVLMNVDMSSLTSYSVSRPVFSTLTGEDAQINSFSRLDNTILREKVDDGILLPKFQNLTFTGDRGKTTLANLRTYFRNQSSILRDETDALVTKKNINSIISNTSYLQWIPSIFLDYEYFMIGQLAFNTIIVARWVLHRLPSLRLIGRIIPETPAHRMNSYGMVEAAPVKPARSFNDIINQLKNKGLTTTTSTTTTPPTTVTPTTTGPTLSNTTVSGTELADLLQAMVTHLEQKIQEGNKVRDFSMDFWAMIGFMVLLAVLCHLILINHIGHLVGKKLTPLGVPPLNKSSAHYPGETRVIMTVGIMLYPLISRKSRQETTPGTDIALDPGVIIKQIAFQLCTLPGSCNDWVVTKSRERSNKVMEASTGYRFLMNFGSKFKWGPICIRLRSDVRQTACESLPSEVKIPISEIKAQLGKETPWFWYKYKVTALTGIILVGLTDSKVIYSSAKTPEGNDLMRAQNILDWE